ncbi:Protein with similarity to mammalian ELMO [Dermatophagoides pteronyssinus]|uniref:Protein with similarity to mammalian ELMO n=1 Tax=Dermatophagoides pteronyssinus TaxID=6956 RepID=A0ABQ8JPE0_DERPT|nr:Protein with similarity to mammalian ELMO [Dermatophagoides pteronyssinus]
MNILPAVDHHHHHRNRSSSTQQQQQQNSSNNSGTKSSKFIQNSHHQLHQQQKPKSSSPPPKCFGCHKPILERYFLKALDQIWHEDCLKCSCCNCRLGEIGSTLFTKADLILCKRDYLRMFGATGFCSLCNKQIPAFEMVMRARGNVYHLECFKCEACNHRFCVADLKTSQKIL